MPILLLFWASLSFVDPLLDAILGYRYVPVDQEPIQEEYSEPAWEPDEYGNNETGEGPFHYSWDNLYLCQFCETEIIIMDTESEDDE